MHVFIGPELQLVKVELVLLIYMLVGILIWKNTSFLSADLYFAVNTPTHALRRKDADAYNKKTI